MKVNIHVNGVLHVYCYEEAIISYEFLAVLAGFRSTDPLRIAFANAEIFGIIQPNENGPVCEGMKFFVRKEE